MNQVAVVIGGGQTLGAFLCRGLATEGYRVAVVDIQSDKAANVAQEINAEYGEGTAYGFGADATSEQSVMAVARGVDQAPFFKKLLVGRNVNQVLAQVQGEVLKNRHVADTI